MNIATARINYRPKSNQLALNITIKSATGIGQTFTPTWQMVMGSKNGSLSWNAYTDQYTDLMRQRYRSHPEHFLEVLQTPDTLVLCCYCADTSTTTRHCHRYLLADILAKIAAYNGIKATQIGEIHH